jgi:hypothetical protein
MDYQIHQTNGHLDSVHLLRLGIAIRAAVRGGYEQSFITEASKDVHRKNLRVERGTRS